MGKRAASKAPASPKVKARKSEAHEVDHFAEECAPVLQLIEQAGVSNACRDMLTSIAPFCLSGSKDSRHEYQKQMIEVLENVATAVEVEQIAAVSASKSSIQEIEAEKLTSAATVAAAEQEAETARQDRDAKAAALKDAEQSADHAAEALEASQKHRANLETDRAALVSEKAEYEQLLGETWTTLKSGNFPGQEWRKKAKLITGAVEMLEKCGLDASLQQGLPVALKAKPTERGSFAEKCIQYAEDLINKHISGIQEKLDGFDTEAANRQKAVDDSESALKDANGLKEDSQQAFFDTENFLLDKDTALTDAKKRQQDLEPRLAEQTTILEDATKHLEETKALIAQFKVLVEGKPEAPEVTEEAPVQESAGTPMVQETA